MARPRYPSDEKRAKARPHVKVHLTVASHQRTAAVWADLELRAMLVELWRIAAEAFAGKTEGRVALSPAALRSITGRERHFTGVSRLATLCSRMAYEMVTDGSATLVTVRNFAKKQGYDSAECGATPPTPPPSYSYSDSDSDSDSDSEEEKNQSAARRSSAAPPLAAQESPEPVAEELPPIEEARPPEPLAAEAAPEPPRAEPVKPRKAAKPAAPAKAPKPSSRAIAIFSEEFKASLGVNPAIPPSDFRALGEAFEQLGEDRLRGALRKFFEWGKSDQWIKQRGYCAHEFLRQLTKADLHAQKTAHLVLVPDVPDVPEDPHAFFGAALSRLGA